jgi:hypothetical protein
VGVLTALAEPTSYLRQLTSAYNLHETSWWLGTGRAVPRKLRDHEIQEWMGGPAIEELASFCHERVDSLYSQIAERAGGDPRFFAEKYRPNEVPGLMWELCNDAREIFLVRDPRDMIASSLAYNAKRGIEGLGRDRVEDDLGYVDEVRKHLAALASQWRRRSQRAHLLRYEDLVLRPRETVEDLLSYLGLDADRGVTDTMVASLSEASPERDEHRTVKDPRETIGRWRDQLPDDVREASEAQLGEALKAFGYSPAAPAEA